MWWAATRACARSLSPPRVPQQVVLPPERAEVGWDVVDATGWPPRSVTEAVESAAAHRFDLATEIPLRQPFSALAETNT